MQTHVEIPTINREQAFDDWFEALRSDRFKQGGGALCKEVGPDDLEHCCVGVLDEVVFRTSWVHSDNYDDDGKRIMVDRFGEDSNMNDENVAPLGLNQKLTSEECIRLDEYIPVDPDVTRVVALAMMNDEGVDFDTIVMLMEELDWKNY